MTERAGIGPVKWYFRPAVIFVMILVAGPFALPLVWKSPALKRWHKAAVTLVVLMLTVWLIKSSVDLYSILHKELKSLSEIG